MTRADIARNSDGPEPKLAVRGPVLAGFSALACFVGVAAGAAALAPVEQGVRLMGKISVEAGAAAVTSQRSGIIARVHAVDGQNVQAGELLVSLETRGIDEEIAAMRAELEAAKAQLDLARLEAATMSSLIERKLASDDKMQALQARLTSVEKETATLVQRIAVSETDLERSAVRAPTAGRVRALSAGTPGSPVQAGGKLLEVVPMLDVIAIEGDVSADMAAAAGGLATGQPARVSLRTGDIRTGKVAWVSETPAVVAAGEPARIGVRIEVARERGEEDRLIAPGLAADVLVQTGRRTLFEQWQRRFQ